MDLYKKLVNSMRYFDKEKLLLLIAVESRKSGKNKVALSHIAFLAAAISGDRQKLQPTCDHLTELIEQVNNLLNNQKFRTLNIIDDYNREALLIEPSHSLPSETVTQLVDQVAAKRGYPKMIRVDNGPEFVSSIFNDVDCFGEAILKHTNSLKPESTVPFSLCKKPKNISLPHLKEFDWEYSADVTHHV